MIVCSGCGNAMEDGLQFCTECGMPNPTTRSGETTASLASAPTLQGSVSEPLKFQNPSTSQRTVPFNQVATTTNRTSLIIVCAVVSGLLLLILGAVGSKLLLSDNKTAERTSGNAQTVTPQNEPATTPERTPTQNQPQTQSQIPPRDTAATFNESTLRREVIDTLNQWAGAARAHDLDRYMSYYADTLDSYYKRTSVSRNYVRSSLAPAYDRYTTLDVQLSNISVAIDQSGSVSTATFDKSFRFEGDKILSGSVQEVLTLTKTNGRWLITGARDLRVYYTNK